MVWTFAIQLGVGMAGLLVSLAVCHLGCSLAFRGAVKKLSIIWTILQWQFTFLRCYIVRVKS